MKKIVIMANPMASLPIIPARFPNRLPQPARPASIILFPAMNSPAIAPITGPTNKPTIPKKHSRALKSKKIAVTISISSSSKSSKPNG